MIPKLGYAYPQEYEPEYLGVREKKRIMAGKQVRQQCNTRHESKFEIRAIILITNILLVGRVRYMEIGNQVIRK